MKSHFRDMGGIDMRGKRTYTFDCGCCGDAEDLRDCEWRRNLAVEVDDFFAHRGEWEMLRVLHART